MGHVQRMRGTYPVPIEPGKPNPGYGGARRLYGDLRDTHPQTFKHLEGKLKDSGGGPGFKSQAELIEERKAKLAKNKKPPTQEQIAEKEKQKKINMLRHKCGVGGRRNPSVVPSTDVGAASSTDYRGQR